MRNLGILMKNNFNCMLGAFQGKKRRKKTGLVLTFVILTYLAICAMVCLQFVSLFEVMRELPDIPMFNNYQTTFLMILILAFQSITGKSKTNDNDLLMSLPIRKFDIVVSKTIAKFLLSMAFESIIILPNIILYSIYYGFSIIMVLWSLLILMLLGIMCVGISYIIDFLLVIILGKLKHSGIYKTIFVLVIFGIFMYFYMRASIQMGTINIATIDDFLAQNIFAGWCVKLSIHNDLLSLLAIGLISIGIGTFGIWLYSMIFGKSFASKKSVSNKIKFRANSQYKSLFNKEMKKLFTTPIYLINSIIGPIMLIVMCVLILVFGDKLGLSQPLNIEVAENIFSLLLMGALFMSATTQVSSVSVSLESRYLWVLKSTPVNVKQILISKALPNLMIFMPVHIIISVILGVVYWSNVSIFILFLCLPILLNVIISFGGVYINLYLPKLDWDNETSVVKNSMSMLVSMLTGILLGLIPLLFNLCKIDLYLCGYLTLGIYVIVSIIVLYLLFNQGVKKFNKLQC